jgi:hypothetical protein
VARQLLPLEDALKALAAEDRAEGIDHPSLETLLAYQEGSLPADPAEALREHLVLCEECSARLLDLDEFLAAEPPEGDEPVPDSQVAAAWERLRPRLPSALPRPLRRRVPLSRLAWPLAAGLLLVVFAGRMVWQSRSTAPGKPQIVELDFSRPQTRGVDDAYSCFASRPLVLRAQNLLPTNSPLRTEVLRAGDGHIAWTGEAPPESPFALGTVLPGTLERGVYWVRVYREHGELIRSFGLHVH